MVGGLSLALTAHTCDPVGWNAIENDHRQVCRLEEFELVEKAANVGRVIGDLELAQTCEPAQMSVGVFTRQAAVTRVHPA